MINVTANFNLFPEYNPSVFKLNDESHVIHLGDLSSNSVLLLWVLLTAGFVRMEKKYYFEFLALQKSIDANNRLASKEDKGKIPGKNTQTTVYKDLVPLTKEEENTLNTALLSITLFHLHNFLLKYGDETCDRRGSDRLIIGLLNRIDTLNLNFKILASNHLHFLVRNFLSTGDEDLELLKINAQGVSFLHLLKSIESGAVNKDEMLRQIGKIYKKRLQLLEYTLMADEKKILISAHAPFDLQSIMEVAAYYDITVTQPFENAAEVASFIDAINHEFILSYVHKFFSGSSTVPEIDFDNDPSYDDASNPVSALFTQKDYSKVNRPIPACFKNITCLLSHGHTDDDKKAPMINRISLNSSSAQADEHYEFPVLVYPVITPVKKQESQVNLYSMFNPRLNFTETDNSSGCPSPLTTSSAK